MKGRGIVGVTLPSGEEVDLVFDLRPVIGVSPPQQIVMVYPERDIDEIKIKEWLEKTGETA